VLNEGLTFPVRTWRMVSIFWGRGVESSVCSVSVMIVVLVEDMVVELLMSLSPQYQIKNKTKLKSEENDEEATILVNSFNQGRTMPRLGRW
jgi:hypothetical protein